MSKLKQNTNPVEQLCKDRLRQVKQETQGDVLYSLQLLLWGLENGELVGPWKSDQHAMLNLAEQILLSDPQKVQDLLLTNMDAEELQSEDALQIATFLAENLHIEVFEDNNPGT